MKKIFLFGLLVTLLTWQSNVFAWGRQVHRLIANIAQERLDPDAKTRIKKLLATDNYSDLASIANWADEDAPEGTRRWHYVNFSDTCQYKKSINCPDGQCIVEVLKDQIQTLNDSNVDEKVRLTALKFVVHLMGDIYQPLHGGLEKDRGGNKYRIRILRKKTNLHAFWDSDMYRLANIDDRSLIANMAMIDGISSIEPVFDPVLTAENDCREVTKKGFYPPHRIPMSYVQKHTSLLLQQIKTSGIELADVLNRAFSTSSTEKSKNLEELH
jgi:nuclease S1